MTNEIKTITWRAIRFEQEKNNRATQLGVFVIMMVIALVLFVYDDYYFSAMVFIGTMMIYYLKQQESKKIDVTVDDKGVSVGDKKFEYSQLSQFWIDRQKDGKRYLMLRLHFALLNPTKIVPIDTSVNMEQLKSLLTKNLKEKRTKERFYEKLINRI